MKPSAAKLIPGALNKLLIPKDKSIAQAKRAQDFERFSFLSIWLNSTHFQPFVFESDRQLGCLET